MADAEIEEGEIQDSDFVFSRDGKRKMGPGLEMEDNEIEEGEIRESDNDPDVALSYIGEKVQTVLGHFLKEFEGAISYENLGTKFGGYDSFLPSDQVSPSWPHTQSVSTPRKIHSPDKKPNSFVSPSARNCLSPRKVVPAGNCLKASNGYVQSKHVEEIGLNSGAMKNPVINTSDHERTLKLRIKSGSRNLLTQKIAKEKIGKHELELSPTSILQTMTSYLGEPLLSPLSDNLVNLLEKRNNRGICENKPLDSMNKKSLVNASGDHRIQQSSSENAATFSKVGLGSTSLTNKTSGNNRRKYTGRKDITEAKKEVNVLGTSDKGLLFSDKKSVRKRRLNEMCESDHQTEKKARVSKLGGKDSNECKNASVGPERKSWSDKDKHNNTKMAVSGSQKVNGVKSSAIVALDNSDAQKSPNPRKKSENLNGQPIRRPTPNSLRKDSSSHAVNSALKEAKDLKHLADRLKNSGLTDGTELYFEAALKFLHGASLLESGISEATKHNDLMHSMDIYNSTAKLCEFCAQEYENSKDTTSAALAYKCMEVAYMRVVYSSHSIGRERNELQKVLQIGGSPSSPASDVDNMNHRAHTRKAALPKAVGIKSRNRYSFLRVLNIAQNVYFAMEASRKSRIALTAATEDASDKESICSLKKALDFDFHDVGGFLQLAHKAAEAISRQA